MPGPKSIADIKLNLLHPATTSHFAIEIDYSKLPENFLQQNNVKTNEQKLNLLCSETILPGSNLATLELNSDHTGVTERHAYRRIYDDRIDFTFYVDAENYLPIRFFEAWLKFISGESRAIDPNIGASAQSPNYNYRFKYRDDYACDGMKVIKFEKSTYGNIKGVKTKGLKYGFVKAYPISITSMPVSYDSSSLLKCSVSMTYMRYYLDGTVSNDSSIEGLSSNFTNSTPANTAQFNTDQFKGINYENFTTTGGITLPSAQVSGNTIKTAFSGVSLL